MRGLLAILRDKTEGAQKKKHEIVLKQIEKVASHVCPNSLLQERELNIAHFLNKYGLEFVQWLAGELELDRFKHQVIRL